MSDNSSVNEVSIEPIKQVKDGDSDPNSDPDSGSDSGSDSSLDELDSVIVTHTITEFNKCPNDTPVVLRLSDKTVKTEFKYIRYFENMTKRILPDSNHDSDSESDNEELDIDAQFISYDIYMKYSAELYNMCDHLETMYIADKTKSYCILDNMTINNIPQYCQDWIKSKKLTELEIYCQSTENDLNLTNLFGCSMMDVFINYWFAYLSIHREIALEYCDEEYYNELLTCFNQTVGVYNPEKFKK